MITFDMLVEIKNYLSEFDYDVRKSNDARYMDQKVTPDVLCIIADCIINFSAGEQIEFTKDDIWNDNYFNTNVKSIFNKPDASNITTKREYDKFTSQPLRTLAYAGILKMRKSRNKNLYTIANQNILQYIALKERNAYNFLYLYIVKVLTDSGLMIYFDDFKEKALNKTLSVSDYNDLKLKFQRFMIGNRAINGVTEVNRIFPKIMNVFSCENNIPGTIKGTLSKRQIYYTDLMYNRPNWRDINKSKGISRTEAIEEQDNALANRSIAYSDYLIQKAMKIIRTKYRESEIKDQWANGEATQIHHIFPKSNFLI